MLEILEFLMHFNRHKKILREYMSKSEEAMRNSDVDGAVENYIKIIEYLGTYGKAKKDDRFNEFLEGYGTLLKRMLMLGEDYHEGKITLPEVVSELEKMPKINGEKYREISITVNIDG